MYSLHQIAHYYWGIPTPPAGKNQQKLSKWATTYCHVLHGIIDSMLGVSPNNKAELKTKNLSKLGFNSGAKFLLVEETLRAKMTRQLNEEDEEDEEDEAPKKKQKVQNGEGAEEEEEEEEEEEAQDGEGAEEKEEEEEEEEEDFDALVRDFNSRARTAADGFNAMCKAAVQVVHKATSTRSSLINEATEARKDAEEARAKAKVAEEADAKKDEVLKNLGKRYEELALAKGVETQQKEQAQKDLEQLKEEMKKLKEERGVTNVQNRVLAEIRASLEGLGQ